VIALAEQAMKAWDAHGAACEAFSPFEEAMFEWRSKNLRPAKRNIDGIEVGSSTAGLTKLEQGIVGILQIPASEYEAQDRDYRAAVAKWERREKAAQRRTGFTKAESNTTAAGNPSWEAMRALRDTPAHTFAGLAAKARTARHLKDDFAFLVYDIGVMSGEIEREAVQS
jgi:hypothetical protein